MQYKDNSTKFPSCSVVFDLYFECVIEVFFSFPKTLSLSNVRKVDKNENGKTFYSTSVSLFDPIQCPEVEVLINI